MGKFELKIEKAAQKHLVQHYKSGDTRSIKKIEKILLELLEHPFSGEVNLRHLNMNLWVIGLEE